MSAESGHTNMFHIQNIYGTPQISRRRQAQVIRPRRMTLIDLRNVIVSDEDSTHRKGSSGTIKSESGITSLKAAKQQSDGTESSHRPSNTMKVKNISNPSPVLTAGLGGGGGALFKMEQTRFPRLEEYAHFHYDLVEIPTLKLSICSDDTSGYKHNVEFSEDSGMFLVMVTGSVPKSWLIKRSLENFATLDKQLHRCIFDRRFSHLDDLMAVQLETKSRQEAQSVLENYLTHLSEIAGGMINCGSVLSWMEMDNRGHRLVATDDSGINTPAIAAAHVIKRYNAQAADEISLQVGDMISVIDMPAAEDTIWWRGKRGFEVGFFPSECVEVIGDKVPTSVTSRIPEPVSTAAASHRPCENSEEPSITITATSSSTPSPSPSRCSASAASSLVGNLSLSSSSAESWPAMMKKHGKLLSFLRTFFSHRPPRNQLKQSGIVKERVFGCDLGEHLLNSGHDVPLLLKSCTDIIEQYGIVHGIYRLSGITSNIQKLRLAFDEDRVPDLTDDCYLQDIHSISSLLKMYFRELPNPLLTYQLYDKFADAVRDEDNKLLKIHDVVQQLPPPHYRTTEYLMRHLARVAAFGHETEMHSKNLAIVWAPNLLRSKELEAGGGAAALQGVGIQAVVTECLICYCDIIFSEKMPNYNTQDSTRDQKRARPKSLAISTPTRLLSLEEARERAFISHLAPKKFIDVGGGPRNLPSKYHTVIDLPGYRKKVANSSKENKPSGGSKKTSTSCAGGGGSGGSVGGWKSIFSKPRTGSIKKCRKEINQDSVTLGPAQAKALTEEDVHNWKRHLRSAKSAESLFSLINSPSSHGGGSLGSRASHVSSDTANGDILESSSVGAHRTSSRYHLAHKRSLSSDAPTVLHNRCPKEESSHQQAGANDEDENSATDRQTFVRGDSARKALHRRLPSAPSTPNQDRKPLSENLPRSDLTNASGSNEAYGKHKPAGDVNIDAAINSRLLQVAERTRSAKSNEELTSPLKRLTKSPPHSRKIAKQAAGYFHAGSSDDDLSPNMNQLSTQRVDISDGLDVSPYDNSNHDTNMRKFYSRFHDYAEILSDDDQGVVSTPDSQGTMSVSSSGCNMQDLLDQIDTRLALNAKLFPRQGIGDTSNYRVGDPAFDSSGVPKSKENVFSARGEAAVKQLLPTAELPHTVKGPFPGTTTTRTSIQTEFPVVCNAPARELSNQASSAQLQECPRGSATSESEYLHTDSVGHHATHIAEMEHRKTELSIQEGGNPNSPATHRTLDKTSGGVQMSTFVGRRHTQFIPSLTATAKDLQNLNELLDSLERDSPAGDALTRPAQRNLNPSHSRTQVHHDRHVRHKHPVSSSHNFESKIFGLDAKGDGRLSSTCCIGGGMSKCLSVPSDIARSLENVTESQSDMLSSVTISELSLSINSFSNGVGDDQPASRDGSAAEIAESDPRHRRSTSLDSLTDGDRLMTRTLREINRQMEAAFKHSQVSSSDHELQAVSHHQRFVASDLDLNSSSFSDQRVATEERGTDYRASAENVSQLGVVSDQNSTPTNSSWKTLQAGSDIAQQQQPSSVVVEGHRESDVSLLFSPSQNSQPYAGSDLTHMLSECGSVSPAGDILEDDTFASTCSTSDTTPTAGHQRHEALQLSELTSEEERRNSVGAEKDVSENKNKDLFSRSSEKETIRQTDEHIVIEAVHVVKSKSEIMDRPKPQPVSYHTNLSTHPSHHTSLSTQPSHHTSLSTQPNHHTSLSTQPSHHTSLSTQPSHHTSLSTQPSHHTSLSTQPSLYSSLSTHPSHQSAQSRTDIASVCKNRSSSSSSSSSETSSNCEECDEQRKNGLTEAKNNLQSLPAGTTPVRTASGGEVSRVQEVAFDERRVISTDNVCLPANEFSHYHVIRRQHSPRSEQRSLGYNLNTDGVSAQAKVTEDNGDENDGRWKAGSLCLAGNQISDAEVSDGVFSLCAVGLVSQRVRLSSRDSSSSNLHSPDSFFPNTCSSSSLGGSVRNALPDLIQSTTQAEEAHHDNRRSSIPLQLALYHPDEFSMDIAASVSSHVAGPQCTSIQPSLSLPQVHSSSHTVVMQKSTLKKSSTDNSICEISNPEMAYNHKQLLIKTDGETISSRNIQHGKRLHSQTELRRQFGVDDGGFGLNTDESKQPLSQAERDTCQSVQHDRNVQAGAYSNRHYNLDSSCVEEERADLQHHSAQSVMEMDVCNKLVNDIKSSYFQSSLEDSLPPSLESTGVDHRSMHMEVVGSDPSVTAVTRVVRSFSADGESIETHLIFLQNSDAELDKEEVQNVLNQGRESLMSPECTKTSGQRSKSGFSPSAVGPDAGVSVCKSSFSKIPRPRHNSDITSPKSGSSGGRRAESSLYSSSMASSVHMDTSPSSSTSSSSSSASSSSRGGHHRRGSETSVATSKRQGHHRRSSDTKLTDLQSSASRSPSSSSSRFDISGRPASTTRGKGSDLKIADVSGKSSRIPLSHRVPSPQSSRGTEATILGLSKQSSKIPSPVPKPRKLSLASRGGQVSLPAGAHETPSHSTTTDTSGKSSLDGHETSKSSTRTDTSGKSSVEGFETSKSSTRTDTSSRTKGGVGSSKKNVVIKDIAEKAGARLVVESQPELKKIQTVHATKVSQPTRQLAENLHTSANLSHHPASVLPCSDTVSNQSNHENAESRKDLGERKTPPAVVARKFHYDSRSLPRWSKFLETQASFPGQQQQQQQQQYSDLLGSRSSLDDSVLQLAAERHGFFLPGGSSETTTHCMGSLRVKRSQKMQSLMDLFERGSDSNISDSSGGSPGTHHRIRTLSGGQLTPCIEVGRGDLDAIDDDTFLPLVSDDSCSSENQHQSSSRERFPSRTGTDQSITELADRVVAGARRKLKTQRKSEVVPTSSAAIKPQSRRQPRDRTHETSERSSSPARRSAAERPGHRNPSNAFSSSSDSTSAWKNTRPPQCRSNSKSRTHGDSSESDCVKVGSSSSPSSVFGTNLHVQSPGSSVGKDFSQISCTHRQHMHFPACDSLEPNLATADSLSAVSSSSGSVLEADTSNWQAAAAPRTASERRNSIKELRQVFEGMDLDSTIRTDLDPVSPGPVVRCRVRSISPQPDSKREKKCRLSLEIPASSHTEVKSQPLRLGPKPFYGAQK